MTDQYPSPSSGQEPEPPADGMTAGLPAYGSYPAAEQAPWPGPAGTGSRPSGTRPWHVPAPPSKALAGWALGLAFLPCLISLVTSVVFAIIVLNRGKDGRDHGKGMAIAALCVAGLWVIVGIGAVALGMATEADRDSSGAIEEEGRLDALSLKVGDCFNLPDSEEVFTVDAIPCSESHQAEVYAVIELPDGDFPGNKQVNTQANQQCADRFKGFVGIAYGNSELEVYLLTPTKRSWQLDDRGITCALTSPGDKATTGSLRNSKR